MNSKRVRRHASRSNSKPKSKAADHIGHEQPSEIVAATEHAQTNSKSLNPHAIQLLQRTLGNRFVSDLLAQRQEAAEPAADPPVVVTAEDRVEYGHLDTRTARADNTDFESAEAYVTYRNNHFGGRAVYDAIKITADAEWDANRVIRNKVGQSSDTVGKRKAVYRWLRLEYRRMGIDTEAEIVALMRQGMTAELQAAFERVEAVHPDLQVGGFVARPRKNTAVGYRLGTLSEHGTGRAFDVRPQSDNPQIPTASWRFIERITGTRVDRSRRRWLREPEALWQDVHDLNEAYETEVTNRERAIVETRRREGRDLETPNPRHEVLARRGANWLRDRADSSGLSFFTLTQDLVRSMAAEGLIWGITFTTPDLHHFELP